MGEERASFSSVPENVDVVIVGAGLAGLTAAREIKNAGHPVVVIEARDRVGGRVLSRKLASGHLAELGAQWMGPGQHRIRALVAELGLRPFGQHHSGLKLLALGNTVRAHAGDIPVLPFLGKLALGRAIRRVERLSSEVPLDVPHLAPSARAWDATTVETWKRQTVWTRSARSLIDVAVQALFAAEPREVSLLYFLFHMRSGGGIGQMGSIRQGAQELRLSEGFEAVARRLAEDLGERVVLGAPVLRIRQDSGGVTVNLGRADVRGQFAIVTVPPALAARIRYEPPLPAARDQLTQRVPMGSVIKFVVTYERPFWRDRGYSGQAVSEKGPVTSIFDDSPEDARHGALVGFVLADAARKLSRLNAEARRFEVLGSLARLFGDDAGRPLEYVEQNWNEEVWTRGGFSGFMGPGTLTEHAADLREPIGRLHWAGTETAIEWNGYMDGAVESGQRAAREVLARLSHAHGVLARSALV